METYNTSHWNKGIEPDPGAKVLDRRNIGRTKHTSMERVMARVLLHVDRVEMRRVCYREHEIEHWTVRSGLLYRISVLLKDP